MFIDKDYSVVFNQPVSKKQADSVLSADARAMLFAPNYYAVTAVKVYSGTPEEIVYYPRNAALAEKDLVDDLSAVLHFTDMKNIKPSEKKEPLEQATIALMVKAMAYTNMYFHNRQNITTTEKTPTSTRLAQTIGDSLRFAQRNLPEDTYAKVRGVMHETLKNNN